MRVFQSLCSHLCASYSLLLGRGYSRSPSLSTSQVGPLNIDSKHATSSAFHHITLPYQCVVPIVSVNHKSIKNKRNNLALFTVFSWLVPISKVHVKYMKTWFYCFGRCAVRRWIRAVAKILDPLIFRCIIYSFGYLFIYTFCKWKKEYFFAIWFILHVFWYCWHKSSEM